MIKGQTHGQRHPWRRHANRCSTGGDEAGEFCRCDVGDMQSMIGRYLQRQRICESFLITEFSIDADQVRFTKCLRMR